MSSSRAMITLTICCCLLTLGVKAQSTTPIQTQVESLLDSWQSRAAAREGLLKLGSESEVVKALGAIAESRKQSFGRRSHAIGLLATFKSSQSVKVLARVTDTAKPSYRCGAIQALAEIASKPTLPVLVKKLDDHSVCMQIQATDPARTSDVYVSDEAVRALEHITGQTFEQESSTGHRATGPWKEWWAKQEQERGTKQDDRADAVDPATGNLRLTIPKTGGQTERFLIFLTADGSFSSCGCCRCSPTLLNAATHGNSFLPLMLSGWFISICCARLSNSMACRSSAIV